MIVSRNRDKILKQKPVVLRNLIWYIRPFLANNSNDNNNNNDDDDSDNDTDHREIPILPCNF